MLKATRMLCIFASIAAAACAADAAGKLKTAIEPGRAGVFIDGRYSGPAANFRMPRTHTLAPGTHEIRLSDPRYEDYVTRVDIAAGRTLTLKRSLKPLAPARPPFGTLRTVHPDRFAAVYVDGRYMGHAAEFGNFAQGLLLNPGTYEVKLLPLTTGSPVSRTVTIAANRVFVLRP